MIQKEKMKESGVKIPVVEESLMHMIYTGFFSSILQIMSLTDFNRKIAYVAQDNYLFNESVRENIRQGNPDAPIVILDEATANVDPENEKELMQQEGIYRRFVDAREQAVSWKL